ncbi:MAG: tetratricopeptide repeat protein [Sandaracinus sp.]
MSKRLEVIETMIAKGSRDPFHHYARGMELRSLGRREEALEALVAVTRDFATYVPTYLMAAQLAQELGRTDQARTIADEGIARARAAGDDHALSELSTLRGTL